MGATLIDENMRAVFVLFTIAFIAAAFAATHEEIHSEAIELISNMKRKGATEADCKDLAKTTCKEVLSEVRKDQKVINSQATGIHCNKLGHGGVTYAIRHYHKRVRQWRVSKRKIVIAKSTRVTISSRTLSSLRNGKCSWVFTSRSYRSASLKYQRAV